MEFLHSLRLVVIEFTQAYPQLAIIVWCIVGSRLNHMTSSTSDSKPKPQFS